ncbi:class I SAM-dependent methyltransferase [Dyella flagellata]|uniref:Methyltransferase type 11 domain-containing protein n=1 Tax=Dyella flagellata TaxID=1867833 RepID=A0ABQ5X9I7_9GAMM|nr:class I SAM-dependent methyltransferase [Dyella flagellata]GLQ87927.1 hypothetical protein GCM10007898_14950 [Dyella flagellata]
MKYYDLYEALYQKIRLSNKPTWDAFFDHGSSFDQFWTKGFIDQALQHISFDRMPPRALELGCGVGQACCYLAQRGFEVSGIDISPTAIAMAQQCARERKLPIRFDCGNVMALDTSCRNFDLIMDGNCLHCVVFDEERAGVFARIRGLLAPGGYFLVSTMCWNEAVAYKHPLYRDESGVLWVDSGFVDQFMPGAGLRCDDMRDIDGMQCLPYRRVLSPEQLGKQLASSGFELIWQHIEPPRQTGVEPMFHAVLRVVP